MYSDVVSIIVPIYNVEKYLDKCLESIQKQTYTNIQVIMVNDGTLDQSVSICKKYLEGDARFILVNKENGGLASARNAGLEKATGKYIACVDSDDWIEATMIETMISNMIAYDADMSVCSFFEEYSNGITKDEKFSEEIEVLDRESALEHMILPGKFYGFSWNKMYKASLIGEQRYHEEILKGEDSPFSCEYIMKCNKIVTQDIPLYHYRVDSLSISRSKFSAKKMTVLDSYIGIVNLLAEKGYSDKMVEMQKVQYANQLLSLKVNIIKSDKDKFWEESNYIDAEMKKYLSLYIKSSDIDLKHKIAFLFGVYMEKVLVLMCKIM